MTTTTTPLEVLVTPLDHIEHQLNLLLTDLGGAETFIEQHVKPEDAFDAVVHLWSARNHLRQSLAEIAVMKGH